jgi:ATP-binding cassette subfamily C (CFTR/MRP) protein 4
MLLLIFRQEIAQLLQPNLLRITNFCFCLYLDKIAVFFCVLTTLLTKLSFTAQFFFVLFNLFRNLTLTVMKRMAYALIFYAEAKSSLKRIEEFLLCEHQESQHLDNTKERYNKIDNNSLSTSPQVIRTSSLCIKNVVVKFEKTVVLNDVSFEASSGELVGITGAAGSGKSTLLQAILKEVEPTKGSVYVEGAMSYAAQEAWIFSASIRQNILFGQEMESTKYQKVIRVCALEDDLSLFPHGDQTLVGERGVMLSGGQKARISLARAVYRDADIYLLDDPLSAVDAHVAEHIFNECVLNYLKNKCVVLVTHQLKYLSKVNKAYFIENGKLTAIETFNNANHLENDNKIETTALKKFDVVSEVKEHRSSQATSQNIYRKYCFAGPWLMSLLILLMFGFVQILISGTDFFIAFWLDLTENPNYFGFEWEKLLSPQTFLAAYASLIVILVLLVHLLSFFYVKYFINVSNKFHKALFDAILEVPIKFFNDHSSGRILNRFSKDMVCIDQSISIFLFEVITIIFYVIGIFIVISISNYWLILPAIGLIIFFYIFAHLFKPINKSIRRTEGIGKFCAFNYLSNSFIHFSKKSSTESFGSVSTRINYC